MGSAYTKNKRKMVQANAVHTLEMRTAPSDIIQTNASSTWMVEIEAGDPARVSQLLQAKLTGVPAEAARVSGPRGDNDVSHRIWEKYVKPTSMYKFGVDIEAPIPVSEWMQKTNFFPEFDLLDACTLTEKQEGML